MRDGRFLEASTTQMVDRRIRPFCSKLVGSGYFVVRANYEIKSHLNR